MKALKKILTTPSHSTIITPHIFKRPPSLKVDIWENIEDLTGCKFGWVSKNLPRIFDNPYSTDNQYDFVLFDSQGETVLEIINRLGGEDCINKYPVSIKNIFDLLKKQNNGEGGILRTDAWPSIFLVEGNDWKLELGDGMDTKNSIKYSGDKAMLPLLVSYDEEYKHWNILPLTQLDSNKLNSDNCQVLIPSELNVTT